MNPRAPRPRLFPLVVAGIAFVAAAVMFLLFWDSPRPKPAPEPSRDAVRREPVRSVADARVRPPAPTPPPQTAGAAEGPAPRAINAWQLLSSDHEGRPLADPEWTRASEAALTNYFAQTVAAMKTTDYREFVPTSVSVDCRQKSCRASYEFPSFEIAMAFAQYFADGRLADITHVPQKSPCPLAASAMSGDSNTPKEGAFRAAMQFVCD